jgi:hypothetical protein
MFSAPAKAAEAAPSFQHRVLLLPPTRRDGEVTCELLRQAQVECTVCADPREAGTAMRQGVGILLLTEHALADRRMRGLIGARMAVPTMPLCAAIRKVTTPWLFR